MRTKRILLLLVAVTLLNSIGVLSLLGLRLWDSRWRASSTRFSDLAALYSSMDATEVSTRFVRPDLFESRDAFARPNALNQILERGMVKPGMHVDGVRRVLGEPDKSITSEGTEGITLGKPYDWHYENLPASGLIVFFTADERVSRIRWIFDDAPDGINRTREY